MIAEEGGSLHYLTLPGGRWGWLGRTNFRGCGRDSRGGGERGDRRQEGGEGLVGRCLRGKGTTRQEAINRCIIGRGDVSLHRRRRQRSCAAAGCGRGPEISDDDVRRD